MDPLKCPKCDYVRKAKDAARLSECPACGVIFSKIRNSSLTTSSVAENYILREFVDYDAYSGAVPIKFSIGGKTIQVGEYAWMTKAITSVSITTDKGKIDKITEKSTPRPKLKFNWLGLMISIIAAIPFISSSVVNNHQFLGFFVLLVSIVPWFVVGIKNHKKSMDLWIKEDARIKVCANVHDRISKLPPTFYTLTFSLSDGSKAAFTSLSFDVLKAAKELITKAANDHNWSGAQGIIPIITSYQNASIFAEAVFQIETKRLLPDLASRRGRI